MRFFVRVEEDPSADDYQEPRALYRWEVTRDTVITERWDTAFQGWVDDPGMIAFTGIGGENDYKEVPKAEADAFRERSSG